MTPHGATAAIASLMLALASSAAAEGRLCAEYAGQTGSVVKVKGGTFSMGADDGYPEEGPVRTVTVGDFLIDRHEVTNAQFARFVEATGYVTVAERGLDPTRYPDLPAELRAPGSMVFAPPRGEVDLSDPTRWWRYVPGASWRAPLGPGSSNAGYDNHPVVHIAVEDARAYATWAGRDLPTEAEWEYAARGGLHGAAYVWGETYNPAEGWKANTWQGSFPSSNTRADGWLATAPVGCFAPNGYGLFDMAGNVWEYVADAWSSASGAVEDAPPAGIARVTIKGGSWLCATNFCLRYRPAARQPQEISLGSNHIGFRTVLRAASHQ